MKESDIGKHLQSAGYSVEKLWIPWRHYAGVLEKSGKKFFFKMAAQKDISPMTKNEVSWNTFVNSELKGIVTFGVPHIYETGEFGEGLFWYVGEYIDGKPLAEPGKLNEANLLPENINRVAQIAVDIAKIRTDTKLLRDSESLVGDQKQAFIEKVDGWQKNIKRDVSDLVHYIREHINNLSPAPMHSDFVPWHVLKSDDTLWLIDGERAALNGIAFYDVAYFYHRTYTKLYRPDLAEVFLQEFWKRYNPTHSEKLSFQLTLAQRLVGGYLDLQTDNVTSLKLQQELHHNFSQNSV